MVEIKDIYEIIYYEVNEEDELIGSCFGEYESFEEGVIDYNKLKESYRRRNYEKYAFMASNGDIPNIEKFIKNYIDVIKENKLIMLKKV